MFRGRGRGKRGGEKGGLDFEDILFVLNGDIVFMKYHYISSHQRLLN